MASAMTTTATGTTRTPASDTVLVLVGSQTSKSRWIIWEIEKAAELGRKLVAFKISSTNTTP